jgi:hypothetical protein
MFKSQVLRFYYLVLHTTTNHAIQMEQGTQRYFPNFAVIQKKNFELCILCTLDVLDSYIKPVKHIKREGQGWEYLMLQTYGKLSIGPSLLACIFQFQFQFQLNAPNFLSFEIYDLYTFGLDFVSSLPQFIWD